MKLFQITLARTMAFGSVTIEGGTVIGSIHTDFDFIDPHSLLSLVQYRGAKAEEVSEEELRGAFEVQPASEQATSLEGSPGLDSDEDDFDDEEEENDEKKAEGNSAEAPSVAPPNVNEGASADSQPQVQSAPANRDDLSSFLEPNEIEALAFNSIKTTSELKAYLANGSKLEDLKKIGPVKAQGIVSKLLASEAPAS